MAIRNDKLGGTDFSDGEVLYDYDLDDTNNGIIDVAHRRKNILPALVTGLQYDFNTFNFKGVNYTNCFNSQIWKTGLKTSQNSTYEFTTDNVNYEGIDFNNVLLNYDVHVFECGDGTSDILDNFDDGTVPTFWTVTSTGTVTNTETDGYWNIGVADTNDESRSISAVSGDLKGTNRTLIIPFRLYARQSDSNPNPSTESSEILLGNSTDGFTSIVQSSVQGGERSNTYGILKLTISGNNAFYEIIGEQYDVIAPYSEDGNVQTRQVINVSGSFDLSSYSTFSIQLNPGQDTTSSSNNYSGNVYLYGVYKLKDTFSSTVNVELSNDSGGTFDTVSSSGLTKFSATGSDMQLKISGTSAANESVWVSYGFLERLD